MSEPSSSPQVAPIHTAAIQFGMRGLRLLPVEQRGRRAILNKWQVNATNEVEFIDYWWTDGTNNIGLCCGPQPSGWNLLCVDVDNPDTWRELEAEHGPVDRSTLCFHRSPSGGLHLFFDVPAGMAVTGTDVFGPGIDARGGHEGAVGCGYVLLPPSVAASKKTGEMLAYGSGPGQGLLDRRPGPAPAWLLKAVNRWLNPPSQAKSMAAHPSTQPVGDDPWSWVRANLRWEPYLERFGWTHAGGEYWTRPGKSPRDGHSAQLHDDGRLAIWTGEVPNEVRDLGTRQSDGGVSISLADFIAAYEYGGDRTAFGRDIRLLHMSPPTGAGRATASAGDEADSSDSIDDVGGSWSTPVNMVDVLNGTAVQPQPTILARTDGVALFYAGSINGIHGESGLGKGWVALTAAAEQIRAGNTVVYLDMEDTLVSIVSRLKILGLSVDEIGRGLVYIRPDDPTSPAEIARLVALCADLRPALVIVDSLGEAFGLDGIDENSDAEVAPWLRKVPRAIAETGACVIIVDHVTKALDNPLYPKGSGRKRGAVGGAAYLVEAMKPLTKGQGGKLRLTCAKDRNGTHTRGAVSAEIVYSPSGDTDMLVRIFPVATEHDERGPQERQDEQVAECAVEMLRVAKRRRADYTKTSLVDGTAGYRAEIKRSAFDLLVEQGHFQPSGKSHYKISAR